MVVPVQSVSAVELLANVFVGLGGVVILSAFDIGESRVNDHAAQPYKCVSGNGIKNENILRRELGKEERKEDEHPE